MKYITRTVWIVSLVSLFTDTASEMLYPVMPIYLKSIGFSIVLIGILEGVAEATAGLSKGYFGKLSDHSGKRVPFVRLGYTLSALSKPMLSLSTGPWWIFFARTMDRFGKGIRTGPRDALLSEEATPATKGKIFGFHKSMDTLGAVIGPSLALIYLWFYPNNYKALFFIAFVPGMLAVMTTLLLNEKKRRPPKQNPAPAFFSFLTYWKESPADYRKIVAGLLAFTLVNSSDVFLLLKVKQAGLDDTMVIGIYIFYNLVFALFAFPAGILADRLGLKNIFIAGMAVFAIVYAGMAFFTGTTHIIILFFLYGIYAAATEGISKAWITNITAKKETATAIGTFTAFQSICTMLASSLTGLIWFSFGSSVAFSLTALVAFLVMIYFISVPAPNIETVK